MPVHDISHILASINEQLPGLWRVVTGGTFLVGMVFAFKALYQFKEYGELRTMMSSQTDLRKPLTCFLIAIVLLYWPTVYHATMQTFFKVSTYTPYAYRSEWGGTEFNKMVSIAGNIIRFIGFVAFIRGWVLLTHVGQQGAQPGAFGKALAHIIAGIFAINIFGTWAILAATFGFKG